MTRLLRNTVLFRQNLPLSRNGDGGDGDDGDELNSSSWSYGNACSPSRLERSNQRSFAPPIVSTRILRRVARAARPPITRFHSRSKHKRTQTLKRSKYNIEVFFFFFFVFFFSFLFYSLPGIPCRSSSSSSSFPSPVFRIREDPRIPRRPSPFFSSPLEEKTEGRRHGGGQRRLKIHA